jgi:3-mercaptopyruvate sulfurtransferase SseA
VVAGVYCSLDQAEAAVDDPGTILWDVRTPGEFDGSEAGWNPPPRLGHMPGAIQLDYSELFDVESGTLRPAAELTTLLGAKGITPKSAVATY